MVQNKDAAGEGASRGYHDWGCDATEEDPEGDETPAILQDSEVDDVFSQAFLRRPDEHARRALCTEGEEETGIEEL